jgi:hypothetical protein
MKQLIFIFFFLLNITSAFSQGRNAIWCFGDSAGIDFNGVSANPISSAKVSRGSCASICDLNGNLLFYSHTRSGASIQNTGLIYNNQNQLMQNGDSILGQGWYYEMTIIPDPANDSSYYLFSIGVTNSSLPGLFYSKIEFDSQNPLGIVTQKNIQLLNFNMVDCLLAVKHGNGRDWWIIVRKSTFAVGSSNNSWYVFLISPSGISGGNVQNIGLLNPTNSGQLAYDTTSNKICFNNSTSYIGLYDFDRCTGVISNDITIEPPGTVQPHPFYWSCEFSPSGQYLYTGGWQYNDSSYLWQFDTWAANIPATKTLIWQSNYPVYYVLGQLKRAPDGNIYLSNGWVDTTGFYNFPYQANQYYPENMNLSVINSPDSAGSSCNFQPYSFYLGGKRTYWGLPNNPDYELGPVAGSPCDTIVSIAEPQATSSNLYIYYSPQWQSAFINADKLKGRTYQLRVMDAMGREVHSESGSLSSTYFTKNLNCETFAKGMYVVVMETVKEKLVKKFVVE